MRCTNPRTVGFLADGKTISWSHKTYNKEYATFQLPCGKCIHCRLEYARQWAIRCTHEAQMHKDNIFLTLTYNEENIGNPKLDYKDFQQFAKKLRDSVFRDLLNKIFPSLTQNDQRKLWRKLPKERQKELYETIRISYFATGEYGSKQKRKHWHAIIFNYRPNDSKYKYTTERSDKVFSSDFINALWGKGNTEFGSVTFESAGYCARYAAKKLDHGKDHEHEFHPISKKSSHQAIGKKFLEKYWTDVFNKGEIILPDGKKCSVPRYYVKWLQKHHPERWKKYVTQTKQNQITRARSQAERETENDRITDESRSNQAYARGEIPTRQITRRETERIIIEDKFRKLQQNLKL